MGHRWNNFVFINICEGIVGILENSKFGVKVAPNQYLTPNLVSTNSFGVNFTPIWCWVGVNLTPNLTPKWCFGVGLELPLQAISHAQINHLTSQF